jgi:hypothetical protein
MSADTRLIVGACERLTCNGAEPGAIQVVEPCRLAVL